MISNGASYVQVDRVALRMNAATRIVDSYPTVSVIDGSTRRCSRLLTVLRSDSAAALVVRNPESVRGRA